MMNPRCCASQVGDRPVPFLADHADRLPSPCHRVDWMILLSNSLTTPWWGLLCPRGVALQKVPGVLSPPCLARRNGDFKPFLGIVGWIDLVIRSCVLVDSIFAITRPRDSEDGWLSFMLHIGLQKTNTLRFQRIDSAAGRILGSHMKSILKDPALCTLVPRSQQRPLPSGRPVWPDRHVISQAAETGTADDSNNGYRSKNTIESGQKTRMPRRWGGLPLRFFETTFIASETVRLSRPSDSSTRRNAWLLPKD